MKNVTYINASAGSGKTYTLTHILAELIAGNKEKPKESLIDKFVEQIAGHQVEPEKVIMTTFTVKAANEMKEEAKKVLYEMNLFEEAARLDQAKIGTIHSVANALINKYWFSLGLPPNMGVMAKEDTQFYISQSLSDLPSKEELKTLHDFCDEFNITYGYKSGKSGKNYDFWKDDIKKVIEYSTNYGIENYEHSEEESLNYIWQFVKPNIKLDINREKRIAVLKERRDYLNSLTDNYDNNKKKSKLNELWCGVDNPTVGWYAGLANLIEKPKNCGQSTKEIREELKAKLWRLPLVYEQQEEYIHLLFDLAKRWKKDYAEYKQEQNLLDYNDMEKYMLQLLTDEKLSEVAEEISKDYRYLFVDEFQDCSPIQVKIFDRLSELMEHSIWVGDCKQAIYRFRGSDIELTQSVMKGCEMAPSLNVSRRSLPDIVEVCNKTFIKTFKQFNEGMNEEDIELKKYREKEGCTSLRYWDMTAKDAPGISAYIAQLVQKVKQQKVDLNEIAVLGRTNDPLDDIAKALTKYNIPTNIGMKVMDMSATTLVMALLALVASEKDSLAKAQVAYLTEKDFGTGKLIEEKLQFDAEKENDSKDSKEFLNDVPLVKQLLDMRTMLMQQSVAALVETMIIELDLYNEVKKLDNASESVSCLNAIIKTAQTYEQRCVQMNLPATVNGFMDYLKEVNPVEPGDANGVQLTTYHSSKGLGWKYVILTSLNKRQADTQKIIKKNIYGVHPIYVGESSAKETEQKVFIRVAPFIYGVDSTNVPDDIRDIIVETPLYEKVKKDALSESNRLLYVGMTRPKDVMILALETPAKDNLALQWLKDVGLNSVVNPDKKADLLGIGIDFEEGVLTAEQAKDLPPYVPEGSEEKMKTRRIPYMNEICTDERKYISPSSLHKKGSVEQHDDICERMPKGNSDDDAKVGDCIHQIFCGIEQQIDNEKYYKDLIDSYGLSSCLKDINAIKKAWTSLTSWLTKQYGEAKHVYHERPFTLQKNGQVFTGSIDLVWQTAEGDILIDFKTCPMGHNYILNKESKHYAGWYAGQLDVYADALEAAGEKVIKRCIYYPVSGMICEISRPVD